jgi:hypothetical protein
MFWDLEECNQKDALDDFLFPCCGYLSTQDLKYLRKRPVKDF